MKTEKSAAFLFLVFVNILIAYVISSNLVNNSEVHKLHISFVFILVVTCLTLLLGMLIDLVLVNLIIKITAKVFNASINKALSIFITLMYVIILSLSNLTFNAYFLIKNISEVNEMKVNSWSNPFVYVASLFVVWLLNKKAKMSLSVSIIIGVILIVYKFLSTFIYM
ncbi:hypothetical protein ACY2DA_12755 [Staphylococcus simulans]